MLNHASRGLTDADLVHGEGEGGCAAGDNVSPVDTGQVVRLLADRLRQVDRSELPTVEKARLTAALSDALLRAIGVDVLDKRLEALQSVLSYKFGGGEMTRAICSNIIAGLKNAI